MWNTDLGTRVLKNAEADAFLFGALALFTDIDSGDPEPLITNAPIFDRWSTQQQIVALAAVVQDLTEEFGPAREPSAWADSVVFASYRQLLALVIGEIIGGKGSDHVRTAVAGAADECDIERPKIACEEPEEWSRTTELLARRVIPYCYWDMEHFFMDAEPMLAQAHRLLIGVGENYYSDIPPEVTKDSIYTAKAYLERLLENYPL